MWPGPDPIFLHQAMIIFHACYLGCFLNHTMHVNEEEVAWSGPKVHHYID
jgi:hypothetical protein